MYKEVIDKKNKTITVITGLCAPQYYNETIYTQKDLIRKIKSMCTRFENDKVSDMQEWTCSMKHKLSLLRKIL